ncbi:MAG TPA: hypothetical protein VGJ19_23525 [Streptosporangiaceae bacterium]
MRLLHRPGPQPGTVEPGGPVLAGDLLTAPQGLDHAHGLRHRALPLPGPLERQAQLRELGHVVADAHAQHQPPAADPVHVGGLPGQHERAAVVDAADHGDQPDPPGGRGQRAHQRPAFHQPVGVVEQAAGVVAEPFGLGREAQVARPVLDEVPHHPEPDPARAFRDPGMRHAPPPEQSDATYMIMKAQPG